MVGTALCAALAAHGAVVTKLVRRPARAAGELAWPPVTGGEEAAAWEGFDAVVHLAGAGIAEQPWSASRKRELRVSRVEYTAALAGHLARLQHRPRVLVSASATGFYGDRGNEWLDETSAAGTGFLADLARDWEAAAAPAAAAGIRVAYPRTGLVLAAHGGALERMLPLFRLGLGGPLGSGRQWWSWITLDDLCGALWHAIVCEAVTGPFNAVAPASTTNAEFTRALAHVLARPALLPVPSFALAMVMGPELSRALLLSSQRVKPAVLERTGFRFADGSLAAALRRLFGAHEAAKA